MNLKIENRLEEPAYTRLIRALENASFDSAMLLQRLRYESVEVEALVISPEETGYSVSTRIFFLDPIGTSVSMKAGIEEFGLEKSPTSVRLNIRRTVVDLKQLIADIDYSLLLVERAVNYACMIRGEYVDDVFFVDSDFVDHRIAEDEARKTRKLRGERVEPFAIIHADSGFDLNTISPNLVPIYKEFDRWDLYGSAKTFQLLPKDFVLKLLKCQGPTLIPGDQFSDEEKEILRDLAKKRQIKATVVAGKTHFFDLDARTFRYLNKALRKKTISPSPHY
ncbi:MAG: hypothetical protein JSV35_02025 [Candidatus Bathyarchaeota archaeon]|nr:MAG: hypothetical protein JSV35_02025 [Candidatus Bathyarchaeota archaeon]